jgi:hypothetical protein
MMFGLIIMSNVELQRVWSKAAVAHFKRLYNVFHTYVHLSHLYKIIRVCMINSSVI